MYHTQIFKNKFILNIAEEINILSQSLIFIRYLYEYFVYIH